MGGWHACNRIRILSAIICAVTWQGAGGIAAGYEFDVVLINGQHADGKPMAQCDKRVELTPRDYLTDPILRPRLSFRRSGVLDGGHAR